MTDCGGCDGSGGSNVNGFNLIDQSGSELESMTDSAHKKLEKLYYQINVLLGGSSIEVELEDDDYKIAFRTAVEVYRNQSTNCFYDTYGVLTLEPNQQHYILNERIDNVTKISRSRGIFGGVGSGIFEPFGAATINTILRGGGSMGGASGDLITYDLAMQYVELLDRLFAREIQFTFRPETNKLSLLQVPRTREIVVLRCSVLRTYAELIENHFCFNWLRKYTEAQCRMILGEKYSKFSTMPGAQGGTQLKGQELKTQAIEMMTKLEDDLLLYADQGIIPQPIRG